jgi:hypothetical protein
MGLCVGDRGVAETSLYLAGTVRIGGARRHARSDRGPIEAGAAVVVAGDDPHGLVVRPAGAEGERLPDHGRPVFASPGERAAASAEREETKERRERAAHRHGLLIGAVVGAAAGGVALWAVQSHLPPAAGSAGAMAAAVLAGAAWGVLVFRLVDGVLGELDRDYRHLSIPTACLGLVGTAAGVALGVPPAGLGGGLAVGVVVTVVLTVAVPGLLIAAGG